LQVDGFPLSLAYSPDGTILAISTAPKAVGISGEAGTFLVDVSAGEIRHFIKSLDGMHPVVTFNVDGSLLVALYSSANQIILWDVQTGNQVHALDTPAGGLSSFPVLSPEGRLLAAVSSDEQIALWNMPQ
jgi:WD40 repeat protein